MTYERNDAPGGAIAASIHAEITRSGDRYVAECLEAAVVTQGRTFDETLGNLRAALELRFDLSAHENRRYGRPGPSATSGYGGFPLPRNGGSTGPGL